uniref:Uncharacterized protein n=1 Tax=Arundo donax TaxID=35708 RepID=A0A0A8ZSP0_ARUDO
MHETTRPRLLTNFFSPHCSKQTTSPLLI